MDQLLALSAIIAAAVAFGSGVLITALTGSARNVKIFLAIVAAITGVATGAALVLTHGLFTYLLFQLVAAVLLLFLIVVAGAVCGGGLYLLRHRKTVGLRLTAADLDHYLPSADFATRERITEERALARIKSGYYRGGRHAGAWYIHESELSQPSINR